MYSFSVGLRVQFAVNVYAQVLEVLHFNDLFQDAQGLCGCPLFPEVNQLLPALGHIQHQMVLLKPLHKVTCCCSVLLLLSTTCMLYTAPKPGVGGKE